MGLLTQNDTCLFRDWFKEVAKLRGVSVKYCYPVDEDISIYSEIDPKFTSPIDMDIIFQEVPEVKTLKKIGWTSEDPSDKPAIAQLPFDAPGLKTKARILIPPIGQAIEGRWFEVTSIHSLLEYPDCYTCTLAPVFDTNEPKIDNENQNFTYIDHERANQPNEDQPANEPLNVNFTFLKNFEE